MLLLTFMGLQFFSSFLNSEFLFVSLSILGKSYKLELSKINMLMRCVFVSRDMIQWWILSLAFHFSLWVLFLFFSTKRGAFFVSNPLKMCFSLIRSKSVPVYILCVARKKIHENIYWRVNWSFSFISFLFGRWEFHSKLIRLVGNFSTYGLVSFCSALSQAIVTSCELQRYL